MRVHVYRNRADDDRTRDQLHFCSACGGWYGVPHRGNHCRSGILDSWRMATCACALCRTEMDLPIEGPYGFITEAEEWQP